MKDISYILLPHAASDVYTSVVSYNKMDGASMISFIYIVFVVLYENMTYIYIFICHIATYIHEAYHVAQFLVAEGPYLYCITYVVKFKWFNKGPMW